jgi:hypothetical protein
MVMNGIDSSDLVVGPPVLDDEDNPLSNNNVARRNRVRCSQHALQETGS